MITSPTPVQPPAPEPEKKVVRNTRLKRRAGETPAALFVKAIFRPIFKGIYYVLTFIRGHKLVSLILLLLFLGSATAVNYYETGQWPLGIGNDPFNFHVRGTDGGGDQVKNWLYALRDGNTTGLSLLDRFVSSPPDPQQLVTQFSQSKAHLSWKNINVMDVFQESDTTIDSFVEVDLSSTGPGGSVSGYVIFHFVTVAQQGGIILNVNIVDFRASQSAG